ncbi:MAG: hypothetical protein U9Q78_06675 [Chloroflexota bacterium]|nr:hypothetical protein [Chloroflexota bacterium]
MPTSLNDDPEAQISILRSTVETKFHIDTEWWEEQGRNLRFHLYDRLCPDCKELYSSYNEVEEVDWVDDETAEVTRVNALWHALSTCCSNRPDYITEETPFIEAIFRVFLSNGNTPLTPLELHERLNPRPPKVILRLLTGDRIYNGIRPCPS